jgi:hypothetical protein
MPLPQGGAGEQGMDLVEIFGCTGAKVALARLRSSDDTVWMSHRQVAKHLLPPDASVNSFVLEAGKGARLLSPASAHLHQMQHPWDAHAVGPTPCMPPCLLGLGLMGCEL